MGAGAIWLHDDQIRLTAKAIDSDHVDPLAHAWMIWITNEYLICMIMGSVSVVRLGEANRTCRRPLD
jgi:hypothetical protein